jgi:hypothetical protein
MIGYEQQIKVSQKKEGEMKRPPNGVFGLCVMLALGVEGGESFAMKW